MYFQVKAEVCVLSDTFVSFGLVREISEFSALWPRCRTNLAPSHGKVLFPVLIDHHPPHAQERHAISRQPNECEPVEPLLGNTG
jgi:hypothetical protein